jgi:hypothetical protein
VPDHQPQALHQPTRLPSRPRPASLVHADFVGFTACPWWPVGMPRCPPSPGSKGRGRPPGQATGRGKSHDRGFARESDAKRWLTSEEAAKLQGTGPIPTRGADASTTGLMSGGRSGQLTQGGAQRRWKLLRATCGCISAPTSARASFERSPSMPSSNGKTSLPARRATTSPWPAARF